jgi:SAM-dependent methyltransferase
MQKEKAVAFWNDFYLDEQRQQQNEPREWILKPTLALFRNIVDRAVLDGNVGTSADCYDTDDDDDHNSSSNNNICSGRQRRPVLSSMSIVAVHVLEIGCGTSTLSEELCRCWDLLVASGSTPSSSASQQLLPALSSSPRPDVILHVIATDISPVCIEHHRQRALKVGNQGQPQPRDDDGDNAAAAATTTKHKVEYQVLDVTKDDRPDFRHRFDLVLDKGCLDTLQFRSKQGDQGWIGGSALDNVRSWLKRGTGRYCVISPRSRQRVLRQYSGFAVDRWVMRGGSDDATTTTTLLQAGDLERRCPSKTNEQRIFLYVCRYREKIGSGNTGSEQASVAAADAFPKSDDACPRCGRTFASIQARVTSRKGRSDKYWIRCWQNHKTHCDFLESIVLSL